MITPTYFHFVLTSETGLRSYCTCFIFWQEISEATKAKVF